MGTPYPAQRNAMGPPPHALDQPRPANSTMTAASRYCIGAAVIVGLLFLAAIIASISLAAGESRATELTYEVRFGGPLSAEVRQLRLIAEDAHAARIALGVAMAFALAGVGTALVVGLIVADDRLSPPAPDQSS